MVDEVPIEDTYGNEEEGDGEGIKIFFEKGDGGGEEAEDDADEAEGEFDVDAGEVDGES